MNKFVEKFNSMMENSLNMNDYKKVVDKIKDAHQKHSAVTLSAKEVDAILAGLSK